MTRWLERLGVDARHWRTLVVAFLKIDFAALRGAYGEAAVRQYAIGLVATVIVYGFSGLLPAVVIIRNPDPMLGATFMTSIVGFMVLSTLIAGEGAAIVSPDDHLVLGFRPVTSRTYFAVRLTTLSIRTVVGALLVGYLPVMAFLLHDGFHPGRAIAALLACLGTAFALTFLLVATYGWLLRRAGPSRVMRVMSYAQVLAQTLTFGGFVFATQGLGTLGDRSIAGTVWMFVYPPAWFASYVGLAAGDHGLGTAVPAALSLVALVLLVRALHGKLSLEYGERLAGVATAAAPKTRWAAPSRWLGILRSETRAVAILVRSQFRHDLKFRLGILALLPISVIYLFMGAQSGPMDPFVTADRGHGDTGLIQLALFFLPMTLRRALVTSDSFRASWIFHASPADRTRLVLAARDIITFFFLVPYLLVLAGLFAYFFGHVGHALIHACFLGLLSHLVLQLGVLLNPQLPLSLPVNKDTNAGLTVGLMMLVSLVGIGFYWFMVLVIYRSATRMAVLFVCLMVLTIVMDQWTRARVRSSLTLIPADGI